MILWVLKCSWTTGIEGANMSSLDIPKRKKIKQILIILKKVLISSENMRR